ncbi:hypothetical protein GCM10025780_21360 [Frondihabitans cladoniiphilus]|uniref:DUF2530 domain-containing protein n=1 Tax=Frondihabitans cladoniiphilus TaxID=715785 RepID=A0ABP8W1M9_9MICO
MGTPYRWVGVAWIALGFCWFALALTEKPAAYRWILGSFWTVFGLAMLLTALFDRRHGRGRYERPGSSDPHP